MIMITTITHIMLMNIIINEDKEKVDFHNCDECMNFNNDENYVDFFTHSIL